MPRSPRLDRRQFLATAAAAGLALAGARAPRWRALEGVRLAVIGVGGRGAENLAAVAGVPHALIAALCDVDRNPLSRAAERHPKALLEQDWRRLFDGPAQRFDGVVISTPDHHHAPIALAALDAGLAVYCEKPLAHNLAELEALSARSATSKQPTQMGIQIQSESAYRSAVAALQQGVLGRVREAHAWVSKSWAGPASGRPDREDPVPASLDWDIWLGPAPKRPFVQGLYHPANWRGWRDFGTGTLGDMGCHIFDPLFLGLGLKTPRTVRAEGPAHHPETFAGDGRFIWTFAETKGLTDDFRLHWTDGAARPDVSRSGLPKDTAWPEAGSLVLGEKGALLIPHWAHPTLYVDGRPVQDAIPVLPSVDHHRQWVDAIRGEARTTAPFSYAAPLTAAVLLGVLAAAHPNETFTWDAPAQRFNDPRLQSLLSRTPRPGWLPTPSATPTKPPAPPTPAPVPR